jgi:hypothetical protein
MCQAIHTVKMNAEKNKQTVLMRVRNIKSYVLRSLPTKLL